MELKRATRIGVRPLIGLYGKSGSGKTMTGLLLARGIVGPKGRIALIDTEERRGSLYADVIPGGYDVLDLEPPFTALRYWEAFRYAEEHADIIVTDSMSHEWDGEGGVLELYDKEFEAVKFDHRRGQLCWQKAKKDHKKFLQQLVRSKVPLICCVRGEEKTHKAKDANGKETLITDEFSTPIQDKRFIFELMFNFETVSQKVGDLMQGGFVIPRKIMHPSFLPMLPGPNEQLGLKHGELIAKWCSAPGHQSATQTATQSEKKPVDESKALKTELWNLTAHIHEGDRSRIGEVQQWLIDEMILEPDETLSGLSGERLLFVVNKTKERMGK